MQNMVIRDNRNAAVFLRIQTTHPRQPIADTDLKPGLVQTVFKFIQNGVAQIVTERPERRAAVVWGVIDRSVFPGD
ncbi:hypothetical protein D3C87_2043220 [compost metagenome]